MINQMFMERKVSAQQKHGVIVCLPKSSDPTTPADYGLHNTGPNHRLPIAPYDGGDIESEPILRGDGVDHLWGDCDRAFGYCTNRGDSHATVRPFLRPSGGI